MKLNNVSGVIERSKLVTFEKMLWRVSKGNIFVRFCDIDEEMKDPKTGDDILKSVFILFYQGRALQSIVKKICDGFHASVYSCPSSKDERLEMLTGVKTRLEDLKTVIGQTESVRRSILENAALSLRSNYTKIRKMKSVYYILNQFSTREGGL